jgi:predicted enzyme related to lactoylglutathione lyase
MSDIHLKIRKISPQLLVADIERSIDFYTTQLGFGVDFRYEDFYAGITKDGCFINLKSGSWGKEKSETVEDLEIVFLVEDLADLYRDMLSKAIEIIQPLREMPYGKEFYIADPDGNRLAFMEA